MTATMRALPSYADAGSQIVQLIGATGSFSYAYKVKSGTNATTRHTYKLDAGEMKALLETWRTIGQEVAVELPSALTAESSPESAALLNLRSQWPSVLARARELQAIIPDPVQGLIDLLDGLPGTSQLWDEIVDEPYG